MTSTNLTIIRNDDNEFDATVLLNGSPTNVTGWTFKITAKKNLSDLDAAAVFQATSAGGAITITDAPNGVIHIVVASALTTTLPPHYTNLYYDLQAIDSGSKVRTLALGTLKVLPDVTLATS